MNRQKRKVTGVIVGLLAAVGMGLWMAGIAEATGGSQTVNLYVTVAPALSVAVNAGNYNFGTIGANVTTVSTSPIVITNDSAGRTENFVSSVTVGVAGFTNWGISASTNGADTFMLNVLINSTQPAAVDFFNAQSTLSGTAVNLTKTYSISQSSDCKGVASNNVRQLWFRFISPTSSSYSTQQTIGVVLTAVDASAF